MSEVDLGTGAVMAGVSPVPADEPAAVARARAPWRAALGRFLRNRLAVLALIWLTLLVLACLNVGTIEAWTGLSGTEVDGLVFEAEPPSAAHPLGTTDLGYDLAMRLLHAGRVSLLIGLAAALCATLIGTAIGLAAGYRGGWLDAVLMRLTDGVLALPLVPLLIVLSSIDLTRLGVPAEAADSPEVALTRMIVIIALIGWTTVARLARAGALAVRNRDFVRAARALGVSGGVIARRHVLPNIAAAILVAATLAVGHMILIESALSFLGVGIRPPTPTWGNMLSNAQEIVKSAPHAAIWPGFAIFSTVMAFNFLGDGLQDALDPRSGGRRV